MDAVFFSMKRAHLGVERLGRSFLEAFGLTPARFDLLNTIVDCEQEGESITQAELWKRLGVVRSAVCEMVLALVEMKILKRRRVKGERTWIVEMTELGKKIRRAAYDAVVNSGLAHQWGDGLIADECDVPSTQRYEWTSMFFAIGAELGNRVRRNLDLYTWRLEDIYACLIRPKDGDTWGNVPWMDEKWIAENAVEVDAAC